MSEFREGDLVHKVGGDYTFIGEIVASFEKISGLERFVVEDDRGVLHVYSAKNLKVDESLAQRVERLELAEEAGYAEYAVWSAADRDMLPIAAWSAAYFDGHDTLCRLLRLI